MPRALTLGNGDLLVNFDARYNMVDLYWPYVGRENQTDGHACRMGIWADGKFAWIEDGAWQKQICYRRDTLVSDVVMENAALGLRLRCSDAVDFHEPLLVREVNIEDLAGRARDVRVFWHHDLRLFGYDLGDTVFFDPKTRCLVHYKAKRYAILGCFGSHGFGAQRWATGPMRATRRRVKPIRQPQQPTPSYIPPVDDNLSPDRKTRIRELKRGAPLLTASDVLRGSASSRS